MSFLKKARFRIFKLGNVQFKDPAEDSEENPVAETVALGPKPEPEQEPIKSEATTVSEWEKLREFQSQWHQVLEQGSSIGIPRMLKIQQGNEVRYFYALRDLGRQEGDQKLAFTLRCLRDDMEIFDVKTIVQLAPFGPTAVKHEFQKVDPENSELNPSEIMQLVQTVLKGETPL